jgi:hypothetical protein
MIKPRNTLIPQEDPTIIGILLTQGQVAIIDIGDLALVAPHRWHAYWCQLGKCFYAKTNIRNPDGKRTTLKMHRLIKGAKKGEEVDHIHHNTLDNRQSETRLCTGSQNQHNHVLNANNTSGYKGVSWDKRSGKWRAHICVNGKQKNLGRYTTPELANEACIAVRPELHGEFARDA